MKLLLTGAFSYDESQLNALKNSGFEITFIQNELEETEVDCSQFDAVVCNSLFLHNDIDKFTNLKVIQLTSAGYDRVPVSRIAQKGIALFNAKGVYNIPMAEWAVLKVLQFYKKSDTFTSHQKQKLWQKERDLLELFGKKVLIIGTGNIGLECAKRFKAFGTTVMGADIFDSKSEYVDEFFYMDSLSAALKTADVVVLTLPLTDKTQHLINKDTLELFKSSALLVNISRGKIINEEDLCTALSQKKLMGAALDVFEQEPLDSKSPLWSMENVSITPHNSFVSDMVKNRLFQLIHKNITEFDYGKN